MNEPVIFTAIEEGLRFAPRLDHVIELPPALMFDFQHTIRSMLKLTLRSKPSMGSFLIDKLGRFQMRPLASDTHIVAMHPKLR